MRKPAAFRFSAASLSSSLSESGKNEAVKGNSGKEALEVEHSSEEESGSSSDDAEDESNAEETKSNSSERLNDS